MQPEVSVIVVSKGRLGHLRLTLPMLLRQSCPLAFEVVVVDFGCPQGTIDWCAALDHRRLVTLKVRENTAEFQRSRSRNCGATAAKGRVLAFVDADVRARPAWLATAAGPVLAGKCGLTRVSHDPTGWDRMGTCVVSAELFHQVRGYDESLSGWGCEDMDFYARCSKVAPRGRFAPNLLLPIRHGHEERVRFHSEKSIRASERRNHELLRARLAVNPNGYGRGIAQIHRGTREYEIALTGSAPVRIRKTLRTPR